MKIREHGKVYKIEDSRILVEIYPEDTASCAKCGCCSAKDGARRIIGVKPVSGIAQGDDVVVEIESVNFLKAGLLLFFMPTAGFLAGILAVAYLINKPPDYLYFAGGLAGTVSAFFILKLIGGKTMSLPEIVGKK